MQAQFTTSLFELAHPQIKLKYKLRTLSYEVDNVKNR